MVGQIGMDFYLQSEIKKLEQRLRTAIRQIEMASAPGPVGHIASMTYSNHMIRSVSPFYRPLKNKVHEKAIERIRKFHEDDPENVRLLRDCLEATRGWAPNEARFYLQKIAQAPKKNTPVKGPSF